MKCLKVLLVIILCSIFTFGQTIVNQQNVTSLTVALGITPNNPNSYTWSENSNIKQGVQINVVPPEKVALFLQQNNSWINFNSFNFGIMTSLEVKYDGGNWKTIFSTANTESGWQQCPFTTIGFHTINLRWRDLAGTAYLRDYDVYLIPQSQKFFKDNYGNTLTLWDGGNSSKVILVSEGFDAYNTTYPEYLRFKGKDLFTALVQGGYKVYFLNYAFNSQDMRSSAAIFNSVAKYISQLNSNTSMTAAGVSMGGVIVRYALAKAEQDGTPLPFSKFVSIDAPQQGAVLSKPLQDYIKVNASDDYQRQGLINTAARQMLNYNTYSSLKQQFYNELNSLNNGLGYPALTQNIGVSFSNGSPNPSNGNWLEIIFRGTLLPTPFVITNPTYFSLTAEEKVPGSYLPSSLLQTEPSPITSWDYIARYGIIPAGHVWTNRYSYSNPTFIPYASSLDIVNGTSKFNKTIQADANYFHDQFPPNVITNLLKEFIPPYSITFQRQFEFDTPENEAYVAFYGLPLTLNAISPLTKNGKTYEFTIWSDGNTSNPRTVIPTGNETFSALYKVVHKSNNVSAFTNNSQRKLVKTRDNWMHQVYESMGRVWLEHSTNNGSTWFLGNNGQPLGNGGGKCPSIDWHYNSNEPNNANYNAVVVAYQVPYNSTYKIQYQVFTYESGSYVREGLSYETLYTEPAGGDQYATTNANPNIAWGYVYRFVLTFERKSTAGSMQPGIYWICGTMDEGGVEPFPTYPGPPVKITGTTGSSINAAVSLNKTSIDVSNFNIVYQTAAAAPANITNVALTCSHNGSVWVTSQVSTSVISYQTGFLNTKPSVVQMSDNSIRAAWIRNWYGSSSSPSTINTVYWSSLAPSVYTYAGNGVNSVSLNIKDGATNTYYAYAQNTNNTTWQNFASNNSSTITLNTTGRDIQLSNGSSSANMYASAFYPASLPYYFLTSNSLGALSKSTGEEEYTHGRGVILEKDEMGFSYSIKSLVVDKTPIKFIEIPESDVKSTLSGDILVQKGGVQPLRLDGLNTFLVSEPFTIREGSNVRLSEESGFNIIGKNKDTDKLKQSDDYIGYTAELIEEGTDKSLGVIKQNQFIPGDENVHGLKSSNLKINSKDEMIVRLKITFASNITNLQGMFVNEYNTVNEDLLSGLSAEELTLQGEGIITTYALEQNYPNPFNPSTTIRYQIPTDGIVTLKIYDALGSEVSTLVNEFKTPGVYNANFNASNLASGVYFYKINVNDYSATKKLILMK